MFGGFSTCFFLEKKDSPLVITKGYCHCLQTQFSLDTCFQTFMSNPTSTIFSQHDDVVVRVPFAMMLTML